MENVQTHEIKREKIEIQKSHCILNKEFILINSLDLRQYGTEDARCT